MMSWEGTGRRRPVSRVSGAYFFLSSSRRAYSYSFFFRSSYSLLAYSSAFLFLGGMADLNKYKDYETSDESHSIILI